MNKILKVWKKILHDVFTDRFGSVISEEIIKENVNSVIKNFSDYSAEVLYYNLVLCSSATPISEIALDYAVRFVDNFNDTFSNPKTCEIDNNPYISEEYSKMLKDVIRKEMILFNDYVETYIHCEKSNTEVEPLNYSSKSVTTVCDIFSIPKLPKEKSIWVADLIEYSSDSSDTLEEKVEMRYYFTISQAMYVSVFGINPQDDSSKFTPFCKSEIQKMYPERFNCMKAFSDIHPNGSRYLMLV